MMNNYILINRTFAETTPESLEIGDFSNIGMIEKNVKVTFTELIRLMQEHNLPSCSPDNFNNPHTWYSTDFYTKCYVTGTEREESIHYSIDNTPNALKYWYKAAKYAANN